MFIDVIDEHLHATSQCSYVGRKYWKISLLMNSYLGQIETPWCKRGTARGAKHLADIIIVLHICHSHHDIIILHISQCYYHHYDHHHCVIISRQLMNLPINISSSSILICWPVIIILCSCHLLSWLSSSSSS